MSEASPHRRALHPALLLSLAQLLWAGNFVLGRATHAHIPPVALAFWRWAVALAVLLPFTWREVRAAVPALRRAWPAVLALGVLGVGNFNLLVYVGLQETGATNAALLNSACPAFILVLGPLVGAPRPHGRQVAGILVSLAGVLAIVARGDPQALLGLTFNRGDAWVLAAVLSWALYTALLPRRPAGVPPLALLTVLVAVGLAWISPWYALERSRGARLTPDALTLGTLAYVGVLASVAAYASWNAGVAAVGVARSGPFLHLLPTFASILAVLLLGEAFRWYHAVGIGLVLLGVRVASGGPPRRADPPDA